MATRVAATTAWLSPEDAATARMIGEVSASRRGTRKAQPADHQLELGVEPKGVLLPVDVAAEGVAPEGEARHERRHDGRGRVDRHAEHAREHAHPDDLVHQAAAAGRQKEPENQTSQLFVLHHQSSVQGRFATVHSPANTLRCGHALVSSRAQPYGEQMNDAVVRVDNVTKRFSGPYRRPGPVPGGTPGDHFRPPGARTGPGKAPRSG